MKIIEVQVVQYNEQEGAIEFIGERNESIRLNYKGQDVPRLLGGSGLVVLAAKEIIKEA